MKGFDNKALILFPTKEVFNEKPNSWKIKFKQALNNLERYLASVEIEPHYFYTDDIARDYPMNNTVWLSTLPVADKFFIANKYVGVDDAITRKMVEFPDIYAEVLRKDPGDPKMSDIDRYSMVLRHNSVAITKLIPKYPIVIHFLKKGKSQYKVASKPNDGKIRVTVDIDTFMPVCMLSGSCTCMCDVFNTPYANRAVNLWEVE